jgi:hypothetical protein
LSFLFLVIPGPDYYPQVSRIRINKGSEAPKAPKTEQREDENSEKKHFSSRFSLFLFVYFNLKTAVKEDQNGAAG